MNNLEELFNNLSNDEISEDVLSKLNGDMETRVFEKIREKKKKFKRNVIVSILFVFLGAMSAFFIINNLNNSSIIPNKNNSMKLLTKNEGTKKPFEKKKEIWTSDDVYFSTFDDEADYAIEQVSLTTYDNEEGEI